MVLPLVWNFAAGARDGNKSPMLLVGGGDVAATRVAKLLAAGDVEIHVVAPELSIEVAAYAEAGLVNWHQRTYDKSDLKLKHWHIVLTAMPDHELSREIVNDCRALRIPVNAADIPELCDFFFGAQFSDGPLQVLVSTGGAAPQVAKRVRDELQKAAASLNAGASIERAELLRLAVKEALPGPERAKANIRMSNVRLACEALSLEQIAKLTDDQIISFAQTLEEQPTLESVCRRLEATVEDPPADNLPMNPETENQHRPAPAYAQVPQVDRSLYHRAIQVEPEEFWKGMERTENYLAWKGLVRRNSYCTPVSNSGQLLPVVRNLSVPPYPYART